MIKTIIFGGVALISATTMTTPQAGSFVAPDHYDYVMTGTYYEHLCVPEADTCYTHAVFTEGEVWGYIPDSSICDESRVRCYMDYNGTPSDIKDDIILAMEVIK